MKILTFDLEANFGFFKKPDINDSIYLTYNMIHKPALLGLFGAILGFQGHFKYGELPEYYKKLEFLKIGIEPIGKYQKNGNFQKTTVKYNNATGHANLGTLNILEQILIKPKYRIYLQLDEYIDINEQEFEILDNFKAKIINCESTFIPYFGKNDFPCWWRNVNVFETKQIVSESFKIVSIFAKPKGITLDQLKKQLAFGLMVGIEAKTERKFTQFERLPIGFNEPETGLYQYSEVKEFVYTNIEFSKDKFLMTNSFVSINEGNDVIYLF